MLIENDVMLLSLSIKHGYTRRKSVVSCLLGRSRVLLNGPGKRNHYEVLRISETASASEIAKAFR